MDPFGLRESLRTRLRHLNWKALDGWNLSAEALLFGREQLWGSGSPLGVWGRWRARLADLAPARRFQAHGLYNVFEPYPGKQDRQIVAIQCLRNVLAAGVEGEVAEFGCFRGHTAIQIVETMKAQGDSSRVLLFDSFQGMPRSDHVGDRYWSEGAMTASLAEVQQRFDPFPNVQLVPGFFCDTLGAFGDVKIKFGHVDADLYTSIRDVNNWLLDRVQPGGIVVYDDYGFPTCEGALQAVDEQMARRDDYLKLDLPTGQFIAIRRR